MDDSTKEVREDMVEAIKDELNYALSDMGDEPSYLVCEVVLKILDKAEKEGMLNIRERKVACDFLSEEYGYDF